MVKTNVSSNGLGFPRLIAVGIVGSNPLALWMLVPILLYPHFFGQQVYNYQLLTYLIMITTETLLVLSILINCINLGALIVLALVLGRIKMRIEQIYEKSCNDK